MNYEYENEEDEMSQGKIKGEKLEMPVLSMVEQFAQYIANEAGTSLRLVQNFSPYKDGSDAGPRLSEGKIVYELLDEDLELATIICLPDFTIHHFEFHYEEGPGLSPIPFLVATIDWLTSEGR